MPKKCPPGVICFENMTLVLIFIVVAVFVYLIAYRSRNDIDIHSLTGGITKNIRMTHAPSYHNTQESGPIKSHYEMLMKPTAGYSTNPQDVFLNPYAPPVNNAYTMSALTPQSHPPVPPGRMPVNVSTNIGHRTPSYTQMGILTPTGGNERILALFGRQLHTSRQKWQYYTISDYNNSVKLPVVKNGKSCTNEYGCDELTNGETVYVEGYNQAFKVTVYENDNMQYIPYI